MLVCNRDLYLHPSLCHQERSMWVVWVMDGEKCMLVGKHVSYLHVCMCVCVPACDKGGIKKIAAVIDRLG